MMKFNDIKMQTSNMWYLYTVFIRLTTLGTHLRLGTCLFCNKTINSNNKMRRRNKARFLYTPKKLRLQESLSLELYQFCVCFSVFFVLVSLT